MKTTNSFSETKICPVATVTGVAEYHWVKPASRYQIQNLLDSDFPISKTPVSSANLRRYAQYSIS